MNSEHLNIADETTQSGIKFISELPPERSRQGKYAEFAKALQANPEMWAEWPTEPRSLQAAYSIARNVRLGIYSGLDQGEFDAERRGGLVYVRYIGGRAA